MKTLFDLISDESSVLITKKYSTSFSIAVKLLDPSIRQAIYNIYGFVRVADEIVDSFEGFPKEELLNRFEEEYNYAQKTGISSNPVINSFVQSVDKYNINLELIDAFLQSMRTDLTKQTYTDQSEIEKYIYGSADVVGLMCLKVFVKGDNTDYEKLKTPAMKLGTAFQKVNFLRDLQQDFDGLNRSYFPNINPSFITQEDLNALIKEIKEDFKLAYVGINQLPKSAKLGVYVAYKYYLDLLMKIEKTPSKILKEKRIRVSNFKKTILLLKSYVSFKFNMI
jgi:15-cis-phytoene synthase